MAESKKKGGALIKTFYDELYTAPSMAVLSSMYDRVKYNGFDREAVLETFMKRFSDDSKLAQEVILACAIRGPVAASLIQLSNGKTLIEMGIPASGLGGKDGTKLSCSRITAVTADLAASFLKSLNVPKRINHDCPGWLQFPAAGGIDMPAKFRVLHKDFAMKFSALIGGEFSEQIYDQMEANSYLNKKLKLFRGE